MKSINDLCKENCGSYHPDDLCIDLHIEGYVAYIAIDAKVIVSSAPCVTIEESIILLGKNICLKESE